MTLYEAFEPQLDESAGYLFYMQNISDDTLDPGSFRPIIKFVINQIPKEDIHTLEGKFKLIRICGKFPVLEPV